MLSYHEKPTTHPNVKTVYSCSKKLFTFNHKQFCNKIATFAHEGAIYCYTSNNSLYEQEAENLHETADKCDAIYFLLKFSKDETGRVMMESLM
jgi:hypothetical protein